MRVVCGCTLALAFAGVANKIHAVSAEQSRPLSRFEIAVDPLAAPLFPRAQYSAACGIISVAGLGPLDGDYALIEGAVAFEARPSWTRTWVRQQQLLLSWQATHGVWAIGLFGVDEVFAYLPVGSSVPPSQSSDWNIYSQEGSTFTRVRHAVSISCPACTAVTVSLLPETLTSCNGPYRLLTAGRKEAVIVWSHVTNDTCTLVHDDDGKAAIRMAASSAAAEDLAFNKQWLDRAPTGTSRRESASVACTSAGKSTRFIVDLARDHSTIAPDASTTSDEAAPSSPFKFIAHQDGSIISADHSEIYLAITSQHVRSSAWMDDDRLQIEPSMEIPSDRLNVRLRVADVEATKSLGAVRTEGFRVSLHGLEGTSVIELCLLGVAKEEAPENSLGTPQDPCALQTTLSMELFAAETQIIQRRDSSGAFSLLPTTAHPAYEGKEQSQIHVVMLTDLQVVDGIKLSMLNLAKHLPKRFRPSMLDLSGATGNLSMKGIYDEEGIYVHRIRIDLPLETWNRARREHGSMPAHLYYILHDASSWEDVASRNPDVAKALRRLYNYLASADAFIMTNGGKDDDAYLPHVARLAGVRSRVLDLGAIASGYLSPLFPGAVTSLVAPSSYVACSPTVNRNADGMAIKVCHPIMNAAKVQDSARLCLPSDLHGTINAAASAPYEAAGCLGGDDCSGARPATFVVVARLSTAKTPGMFVRAMAVLQERFSRRRPTAPPPRGVLVGGGPLQAHMQDLARRLNASVHFAGYLPPDVVPCEVRRATALVLPSFTRETFGMAGPEAMLLGVPVITFGFGGSAELVQHMGNGIIVRDPTPRALADAMELLAQDSALRDRLGIRAVVDGSRALALPDLIACYADELI